MIRRLLPWRDCQKITEREAVATPPGTGDRAFRSIPAGDRKASSESWDTAKIRAQRSSQHVDQLSQPGFLLSSFYVGSFVRISTDTLGPWWAFRSAIAYTVRRVEGSPKTTSTADYTP